MEKERIMGIIESILFAAGREVTIKELMTVLEAESIDIISIVNEMKENIRILKDVEGNED